MFTKKKAVTKFEEAKRPRKRRKTPRRVSVPAAAEELSSPTRPCELPSKKSRSGPSASAVWNGCRTRRSNG